MVPDIMDESIREIIIFQSVGVDYDILYDENLAMARNMELIHKDAIPGKDIDLAQPATFLFDANGMVIWSYISTNYRIRPETMDLLVAAEKHFGS